MKIRNLLSLFFVISYSFVMVIFGNWVANSYSDGSSTIILTFIASFVAATIIWGIWNLDISVRQAKPKAIAETNSVEKRKRERLDTVLHDLSDADLLRLRQRLNDGTINDDSLEEHLIGEDGELLYQEKRR